MNSFSHDYAHCTGQQWHKGKEEVCPKRERCHRYALHLDAVAKALPYATYFLHGGSIAEGCGEYWAIEPNEK